MLSTIAATLRKTIGPLRVMAIGDSITQNDSYQSPNGLWTEGNGYFESVLRSDNYLYMSGGQGWTYVGNAGIGGNTTPQMLARVDTDVIAHKPDFCFIMAGTNDILPGAVDADYVTLFNALERLIVKLLIAGIEVALFTCPAKDAAPNEVSRAIPWYYLLAKHYGIPLVDTHKATADPVTGHYRAGYSSDGTHPNEVGINAIAAIGWTYNHSYRAGVATVNGDGQQSNLIANGLFVNNTTPPAMDFWTVNTTGATFTQDPSTRGVGKTFDYKKTAAGGAYALYGADISGGSTTFNDGDTLVVSGLLSATTSTGSFANGFSLLMSFSAGGGDSFRPINNHIDPVGSGVGYSDLYEFSQEAVVPAGFDTGTLTPQLYVQDIGTYKMAEFTLWNKTKYEAVWKPGNLLNI